MKDKLNKVLRAKGLTNRIGKITNAPQLDRYEIDMVKFEDPKKYKKIEQDLQVFLKNKGITVVIDDGIFIDIPKKELEIIHKPKHIYSDYLNLLYIGKDTNNQEITIDLKREPHLLISGASGTGKSVLLSGIISDLLNQKSLVYAVDTKKVSFGNFTSNEEFLLSTNTEDALITFETLNDIMEVRYGIMEKQSLKSIYELNKGKIEELDLTPITIIIDEMADILFCDDYGEQIERIIKRIIAKGRGAGIHLVLATQRADASIISPIIKSNASNRISFKVASTSNSRVALDVNGAEKLRGQGDFLFVRGAEIIRGQAYFAE